jgi:ethanolamine ammonia-lyase large subunit
VLGLGVAPEFEQWLKRVNIMNDQGEIQPVEPVHPLLQGMPEYFLTFNPPSEQA